VRTLAYNAIFIASVSTVLFNANPLLRYDGYYILADLIEIPNLRSRANAYLFYLCERYLFGNTQSERPQATWSERAWFVFFGILSSVYRVFVVVAILFYVADKLFNLGAILAIAAAAIWLVFPLLKGGYFLLTNPRLRKVRVRAITVTAVVLIAVISFITLVPMPYRTGTEGVIWIPEESFVRAGAEGFIDRIDAIPDSQVVAGVPLITLSNPNLVAQEKVTSSYIRELEARYTQFLSTDPVKAEITQDELRQARVTLARVREEIDDLTVRSQIAGKFIVPVPEDLPARFVRKGELLGYVLEADRITIRTIVSQAMIDMVRSRTDRVEVRLSERVRETVPAVIKRIVPGASEQLPARALGTVGGGGIATDPTDREGLKAFQRMFQMDLELPLQSNLINLGGRGYVRFDHGWAPLAVQWYFEIRQIFLSRFNV
jgi:putative peptide zinc metalloprotease protein